MGYKANEHQFVVFDKKCALGTKMLSRAAKIQISELRDRIHETLYQVARETHPNIAPSSRFGNLLLLFPTIMVYTIKIMPSFE